MSAPSYSLRRQKTGKARPLARTKLDWSIVRDIRQWAAQQGACLIQKDQLDILEQTYPISRGALREVLTNRGWYDPRYTPGMPDADYYAQFGELHTMYLILLSCRYAAGH